MNETRTPIDVVLLDLLRCPQTGSQLRQATAEEVRTLNQQIEAGTLQTASGDAVVEPLDDALVSQCETWIYPIREAIPAMIPEEAIPAACLRT